MMDFLTGGWPRLILIGVVSLAICLGAWWIHHTIYTSGFNDATAAWSAKYDKREADLIEKADKERSRQIIANNEAKKAEAERIAQLEAENTALENNIRKLEDEAALDPDADKPSLSPAGRLRINSVR